MTPEKMRVVLAEAEGWQHRHIAMTYAQWRKSNGIHGWFKDDPQCYGITNPPDYSNDLNAMREAEDACRLHCDWELQSLYIHWLKTVCYRTKHSGQSIEFAIVNASADQKLEALIRTLGKWEE